MKGEIALNSMLRFLQSMHCIFTNDSYCHIILNPTVLHLNNFTNIPNMETPNLKWKTQFLIVFSNLTMEIFC